MLLQVEHIINKLCVEEVKCEYQISAERFLSITSLISDCMWTGLPRSMPHADQSRTTLLHWSQCRSIPINADGNWSAFIDIERNFALCRDFDRHQSIHLHLSQKSITTPKFIFPIRVIHDSITNRFIFQISAMLLNPITNPKFICQILTMRNDITHQIHHLHHKPEVHLPHTSDPWFHHRQVYLPNLSNVKSHHKPKIHMPGFGIAKCYQKSNSSSPSQQSN